MDFFTNFGTEFFTQFSPVIPFDNELYEEIIESFSSKNAIWPCSHALTLSRAGFFGAPAGGGGGGGGGAQSAP